jgi:predicted transcriptional regulator
MEPPAIVASGRDLAARALVAGAHCTQQRAADLLETSRRSVGRAVDSDLGAAVQDAGVVTEARTVLAESVRRGSTPEEREAADRWLAEALRDESTRETAARRPTARRAPKTAAARPRSKKGTARATPLPASFPIVQIEALERQQQRILHRTQVVGYVLAAEQRNGARLTVGDALADLLQDISEAARTIGTILQPTPKH